MPISGKILNEAHFDKTIDGRIVLFDYDCTREVLEKHYS